LPVRLLQRLCNCEFNFERSIGGPFIRLLLVLLRVGDVYPLPPCVGIECVPTPPSLFGAHDLDDSEASTYVTTDISAVVKQLVFSPEKDEEQGQQAQQPIEMAVEPIIHPVIESSTDLTATVAFIPTETAPMEQATESAGEDVGLEHTEFEQIAPASSDVPMESEPAPAADAAMEIEEDAALFPTFVTAVQGEALAYVSMEMKTQEKLLLDAIQVPSTATKQCRKRPASRQATPSWSAKKQAQMDASERLSASARKRPAASQTPKVQKRDTNISHSEKKHPNTGVKRKLTLAASPMLTTLVAPAVLRAIASGA
jgi:hypothetical protein